MSAAQRLPFIAGLTGAGASFTAVAAIPSLRLYLIRILGVQAPGGIWRFLFIILALLNLKNLPFIWHVSVDSFEKDRIHYFGSSSDTFSSVFSEQSYTNYTSSLLA